MTRLRTLRARLRSFGGDRRAATAVEFAMVVGPFLFLMFACFEYILVYLVTVTLDNATINAARQIRTGEAQTAKVTAGTFRGMVCDGMGWLAAECPGSLSVDVRVYSSFSGAGDPNPTTAGVFDPGQLKFNMGKADDIVLVTTYYKWQLLTGALDGGLSTSWYEPGYRAVMGRAAFRNEPYGS